MAETNPARERLLDAVIEHFSADGLGDQSLRQIAAAVASSHRMLLYHFGSKEGLLVEVARAVEARTMAQFEEMAALIGDETDQFIRAMWQIVADPEVHDFERLFFALYGRGLQGEAGIGPLMAENIEGWLDVQAAWAAELGITPSVARVHARLGMAVTRGLLLDLLATGDRKGVSAALDVFARRYEGRWWEDQRSSSAKTSAMSGEIDTAS